MYFLTKTLDIYENHFLHSVCREEYELSEVFVYEIIKENNVSRARFFLIPCRVVSSPHTHHSSWYGTYTNMICNIHVKRILSYDIV